MVQANFMEQLLILFKVFKTNSYVWYLSIIAVVLLLILMLANKFKNKKITKILCILAYLGIFGILLYFYHEEILKLLDYLMNNIFLFLFFPNLAVYILVLIIINIIVIKSTFSSQENKIIKNINIVSFVLFNIIFYLIIDNVIKNKINVYEQLSIYTNNELLVLIELSMKLFLGWGLLLLIIKVSVNLNNFLSLKKAVNRNLVLEEVVNQEELKEVESIPDFLEILPIEQNMNTIFLEESNKEDIEFEEPKYNIYNDYIDIKPIKKNKVQEVVQTPYYGNSFSALNIVDSNISNNNFSVDNEFNSINDYDNSQVKNEIEVQDEMQLLFDNNDNYLKNIMFDIEKLRNNYDDKNQIKKIYEDIQLNQKDLTLKDYNHLIDMLLSIKK